jgi:peptide/nickel transport system permease protein
MARHLLHRFLLTLPALWLVLTLVFLLIHIVPGDPVEQMLGEGAAPGQVEQLRHTLGLDQPLAVQYGHYLWGIVRGDLGQSFKFQAPVRRIIFERYPATLQLAFLALLVCAAIAIPAGVVAAHRRGSVVDRSVGVFSLFGLAMPNFALGPLLIVLFSHYGALSVAQHSSAGVNSGNHRHGGCDSGRSDTEFSWIGRVAAAAQLGGDAE